MRLKPGEKARGRWRPELGFEVWARGDPALNGKAKDALTDRFIVEAIEANRLVCGGGVFGGRGEKGNELSVVVVKEREYASCTNRDRGRVEHWLASQPGIVEARVGPLVPADREGYKLDRPALPRPEGKNELERALWFRKEAIGAYRKAAAVLGRPEIREAERNLERSVELVQAGVDEVGRALFRKLDLPLRRKSVRDRQHEITSFFDYDLQKIMHPKRRRVSLGRTPLQRALSDVTHELDRADAGVIDIPDMHEFERNLVGGSRTAIDEMRRLIAASSSSTIGKQLREAAGVRRDKERKERASKRAEKKPRWPRKHTAVFAAQHEVRATAVIGEDHVDRTIIPDRLARACGAELLPLEVPVFLRKRDDEGYTDWDRSRWIGARPALVWVSVPRTPWKAPVLAAVVPTARCPLPQIGKDWFQDAVERRHEQRDEKDYV